MLRDEGRNGVAMSETVVITEIGMSLSGFES
jgi:hypothetical protein